MKKLAGYMMMIAVVSLMTACGGGASEDDAAAKQAEMDSIAQAEEDAAMLEAEQAATEADEAGDTPVPADSTEVSDTTAVEGEGDGESTEDAAE